MSRCLNAIYWVVSRPLKLNTHLRDTSKSITKRIWNASSATKSSACNSTWKNMNTSTPDSSRINALFASVVFVSVVSFGSTSNLRTYRQWISSLSQINQKASRINSSSLFKISLDQSNRRCFKVINKSSIPSTENKKKERRKERICNTFKMQAVRWRWICSMHVNLTWIVKAMVILCSKTGPN